ncbi:MAG: hypothetical protein GWP58_10745 [Gammaproteobacteria bacterium]|nr:hypothetical protein [Gammaproteobacteria bacterium]
MAYHRIYKYSSIGRPLDPKFRTNQVVLALMPAGAGLGAVTAWLGGQSGEQVLLQAMHFFLIVYCSWALARELDPDDHVAAFISLAIALFAALTVASPGILIVFATLGLVRIVNRSTGLAARQLDSVIVMLLAIAVIYSAQSPYFGLVAALAFILDGSLKEPLRRQWIYALVCFGGTIVYLVDHDVGLINLAVPDSLFGWLALLFLLIFALNTLLLKEVHSRSDVNGATLDLSRVRGGMVVGLMAALQGIGRPEGVVIIVTVIAGIGIGMAFRKGFKSPASG